MHESDIHKALHRNHCPCVWGSGTEAGIIIPYCENILNRKKLFPFIQGRGSKCLHRYDIHETLYLNFEIHNPWIRGSEPLNRSIMSL